MSLDRSAHEQLVRRSRSIYASASATHESAQLGAPLSYTQESLWLLSKISQQQPTYHEPVAFRIAGALRVDLLREALRLVIERHPALRTSFTETAEGLRAIVRDGVADVLEVVDLCHLPASQSASRAEALVDDSYGWPFDLEAGPLVRAIVVQLADDHSLFGLTVHHLVTDGWSLGITVDEIGAHYRSLRSAGTPAALPALALRYTDHALEVRRAYERGDLDDKLEFWRRSLEGSPDLLTLPTDRSRPPVQTFRGATCSTTVPRSTIAALVERGRRECGSTEFQVLLSAYAVLLRRYSGQDTITIGTPLLNRSDADQLGVVGCFVNTAPLVFSFDDNTTFRTLLTQITSRWADVLSHQDAPYPKILERLEIQHDPSHSPVFQTMMTALGRKRFLLGDGIVCKPHRVTRTAAKFEFLLYVAELNGDLELEAEFNTDLFDRATIERILKHYTHLLEQLTGDLDVPVSRISILPPEERRLLLDVWNDTRVEYPGTTVIDAFEAQATRTPDAIAVELDDRALSYDALDCLTNRVAHALTAAHGQPGGFVGVYMERSIDMVVALLAIVKAGMAYVPIDPEYPADRIRYMIEDSQVQLVLTQDHHRAALREACEAVTIDELVARGPDDTRVARQLTFDSRVYMIYTSGSTGRPKGVINRHGSLFNRLAWMQAQYPLAGDDRVLQKTPFSFDVSVWEFFWPLMFGARIVVARPGGHRDAEYLKRLIEDKQVTTMHFVPSMLNVFLEEDRLHAYCGSLRRVFCSGEALPYKTVEDFYARVPCELHNLYGPTEAAIDVSYWPCSLDYPGKVVPIGKPIANTRIYIVDRALQLQPIGVPGELCIGGVGLAERYHNRDDLTRKAFVPDPFTRDPDARMYRTGDLARYLADGQIEYLGRIDNQVKLRGFRIELGEIEAVVQSAPGVRKAAVIVHDTPSNRVLVAYVVTDDFDLQRARDHLKRQLPDFMVPQIFVPIATIPMSANGKLDRKALPDPFTASSGTASLDHGPPASKQELALLEIWREVLGAPQLDVESNFFRSGGDSILSIRIAARLRDLGYHVEVQEIFAHPTVRQLGHHLATTHRAAVTAPTGAAFDLIDATARQQLPGSIEDAWPLTRLQSGMIYHSLLREQSAVYHDIFSYDLQAPVHEPHLVRAIHAVVACHPQLRSSFDLNGFDEPLQLVHADREVPVDIVDLAAMPRAAQDEAIARWVEAEKQRGFDLEHGPLLRFQVHVRSASELTLTLSFHHVILDGWSVALVVEELRHAYAAPLSGQSIALHRERTSYGTYVALERRAIQDPAQVAFWLGTVASVSAPCLLGPAPGDAAQHTAVPRSEERVVPAALTSALQALADRLGLPLKTAFLALHLHALGRVTGRTDVVSGMVVHGRPEVADGEKLVGLFLNTVPLVLDQHDEAWPSRLARVFALEQDTIAHRRFPLAEILKRSGHKALFDVLFNYTNFHVYQPGHAESVEIAGVRYFEQTNFSVVVHAHFDHFANRMTLAVNYDAARVDGAQITRYLDQYFEAATAAVSDAGATQPEPTSGSDRRARVGAIEPARRAPHVAPRTALERRMCEIVAAAIGVAAIGIDDPYLELGVDSITAIRVVAKIKRLGIKLALQDVFEHPTIRRLAAHAETARSADPVQARVGAFEMIGAPERRFPPGVVDAYPATALQLDMIEHSMADVARAIYHDMFSYQLALPLDELVLRRTLQQLVDAHETLRTAFDLDAHPVPLQHVFGTVAPHLDVFDLSALDEHAQAALFDRWFDAERGSGFDVSRPAPIRWFAHRRGPRSFTLTLSFHHAIIDGWSLSLLVRDLVRGYAAGLQAGEVPAPKVPALKLRDYVRVELESRRSEALRSFWQHELRGASHGALPRPAQVGSHQRWSETKVVIDRARQDALTALCNRLGVPVKHGVLAAHLGVMSHLYRQTDVVTGVFVNGRLEEEEGEDVLGLFLNFMPFRQDVHQRTWRSLVEDTFANDRRRLPYRRCPLSSMHRDLGWSRPLESVFNYTQFKAYGEVARDGAPGTGGELVTGARWFEHTHFPLLVNAGYDLRQEQMILTLNGDGHVLPQWSIEVLGELYAAALTDLVTREDALVSRPSDALTRLVATLLDSK